MSLKHRIQFYRTLATLEGARLRGLGQPFPGDFRRAAQELAKAIQTQGVNLGDAMAALPRVFTPLEVSLIRVGERSGRLELVFKSLAEWHELLMRLRGLLFGGMIQPALTYHVAAVLIPAISFFMGRLTMAGAATRAAMMLGLPYLAAFLFCVVRPAVFPAGLPLPEWLWRFLLHVPAVGTIVFKLDCTRFFQAFALGQQAGLGLPEAARLGAGAVGNAYLRRCFHEMAGDVARDGCPFSAAFQERLPGAGLSAMVLGMLETGEQSGRTDEMAARIARQFQDETELTLTRLAKILPVLIYLVLMLYVAFQILSFYAGLYAPARELLE